MHSLDVQTSSFRFRQRTGTRTTTYPAFERDPSTIQDFYFALLERKNRSRGSAATQLPETLFDSGNTFIFLPSIKGDSGPATCIRKCIRKWEKIQRIFFLLKLTWRVNCAHHMIHTSLSNGRESSNTAMNHGRPDNEANDWTHAGGVCCGYDYLAPHSIQ